MRPFSLPYSKHQPRWLIVSASAPFVFALAMSNLGALASIVIVSGIGTVAVAMFVMIERMGRKLLRRPLAQQHSSNQVSS